MSSISESVEASRVRLQALAERGVADEGDGYKGDGFA
jgi:hypothetical protein